MGRWTDEWVGGGGSILQGMCGNPWRQPLGQLVLHVVNHGTHHRSQVSRFLRVMGHVPPKLDLVSYYREYRRGARTPRRTPRAGSGLVSIPTLVPEAVDDSDQDGGSHHEYSQESNCVPRPAIEKVAHGEQGRPDHEASGTPAEQ